MGCLFCKIAAGEIPSQRVFESENVLAFRDISPKAPVHILIIPKQHIVSIHEVSNSDNFPFSELFEAIHKIAIQENLPERGYRIVSNVGEDGGQTVSHLHFHLLGGRALHWPPG
jgi:histidine triad (HIT) family protein